MQVLHEKQCQHLINVPPYQCNNNPGHRCHLNPELVIVSLNGLSLMGSVEFAIIHAPYGIPVYDHLTLPPEKKYKQVLELLDNV